MYSMLRRRRPSRRGEESETAEVQPGRAETEADWPDVAAVYFWSCTVVTFGYGPSPQLSSGAIGPARPAPE
ncbi:hypothetical protein GCM10010220_66210 [Streptomyces parvulus]|uniref:Uncharacterized protein n=1 Tax=Streptomyces parvulus TaxID=146923 RepID=A0A191VAN6_9ACTN|nr:hypothetical protein Spa2297_33375 [Streptomyces parvulus]GGS04633.1 hypothetical protein GCM10010220_66210 [Streptomyces parvulus]